MSIKTSIYHKAKSHVKKEDLAQKAAKYNLDFEVLKNIPTDLIEIMETAVNYRKNANVMLDIGTHMGKFTAVANLFVPFDKTICFEPNKQMNEAIKTINNNIDVSIANIALSDKKGVVTFHLHEDSSMNSIVGSDAEVLKSEFPWDNPDLMKETEVPTDTLDNYIQSNQLQDDTFFIKIDTQGNELTVLRNGIETLKKTEVLLIEYMFLSPYENNFSHFELLEFLNENGFDCKGALTISKRPSKKVSAVDFIFVKRS